jgi:hypothetical protein
MRIAYLTEWPPYVESGVLRKMIGQIDTWREQGCEAEIFTVVPLRSEPTAAGFAERGRAIGTFTQTQLDRHPRLRLGFLNKVVSVPRLRRALAAFRPDIIYYRQNGPWYPGLARLLRSTPSVAEINTFEGGENHLWGARFARFHDATRARLFAAVDGLVCMTNEIAEHERAWNRPIAVIGNSLWGAPRDDIAPTKNKEPAFVFTGSPMTLDHSANWHGVDKIFPLAAAMPDSPFHVAGMKAGEFAGFDIPPNVVFHGFLNGDALTDLYRRCDIGIASLAAYRKNIEEGCSLKVRDYLMHRLPLILGYRESQDELNHADYVLPIGNTPDNVTANIDRIARFSREWTGRRVTADLSFITREKIERRRLDFMRQIVAGTAG